MKNIKCLSAVAAAVLSVCVCPVSADTPTIASAADTLAAGCWAALPLTGEIEDIVTDGTLVVINSKKLSGAKSYGTVNSVEFGGSFSGDGGMTSTPEVKNSNNNCTDCNVSDTSYRNILKSAFEGTSAAEHQVFTFAGLTANATYLVQYICHGQTEYPRTATVSDVYGVHRIELSAASGNLWYYGGTLLHVFKAAADGTYTLTIDFRDASGANAYALVNAFQVRQIEDRAAPAVPANGIWSAQMVSKDAHEFTTEGELVWAMTCSSGDPGHTHYVNRIPFGDCGINTSDFHLSDYAAFSPALTEAQDKFGSEDCGNDAMTFGGTLARGWFINSSSGTGSFTMTVKGLTAGETYRVQLFSHNNGINTDHNDGLPTDTITAPDGVQTIQLGDPDPSDGDMSWRYGGILNGTFIATGTEQTFTFTHTRTGYYQINAIQLRHVASMSPEGPEAVEPAIGGISASASGTTATITLSDVEKGTDSTGETDATTYDVFAYEGDDPTAATPVASAQSGTTAEFQISDLAAGTHVYHVYIENDQGVSSVTNTVSVKIVKPMNEWVAAMSVGDWRAVPMTGSPSDIATIGEISMAGNSPMAYAKNGPFSGDTTVNGVLFRDSKENLALDPNIWTNESNEKDCGTTGDYKTIMTKFWGSQTASGSEGTSFTYSNLDPSKTYLVQIILHNGRDDQYAKGYQYAATAGGETVYLSSETSEGEWYYGGSLLHVFQPNQDGSYTFHVLYYRTTDDLIINAQLNAIQLRELPSSEPDPTPVYTLTIPAHDHLSVASVTTNGTAVAGTDNAYSIVSNTEVTITFAAASGYELDGNDGVVTKTIVAAYTFVDADYPAVKELPKSTIGKQAADLAAAFLAGTSSEQWLGLPMTGSPDDIVNWGAVAENTDGKAIAYAKTGNGNDYTTDASLNGVSFRDARDALSFAPNYGVFGQDNMTTCGLDNYYGNYLMKGYWKGNIGGGSGATTFSITVPAAGTYLMQLVVHHTSTGKIYLTADENGQTGNEDIAIYGGKDAAEGADWYYGGSFVHVFTMDAAGTYQFTVQYSGEVVYNMFQLRTIPMAMNPSIGSVGAVVEGGSASITLSDISFGVGEDLTPATSYDVYMAEGENDPVKVFEDQTGTSATVLLSGLTTGEHTYNFTLVNNLAQTSSVKSVTFNVTAADPDYYFPCGNWVATAMSKTFTEIRTFGELVYALASTAGNNGRTYEVNGVPFIDCDRSDTTKSYYLAQYLTTDPVLSFSTDSFGSEDYGYGDMTVGTLLKRGWGYSNDKGTGVFTFKLKGLEKGVRYTIQLTAHNNGGGSWAYQDGTMTAPDGVATIQYGPTDGDDTWKYGGSLIGSFIASNSTHDLTFTYSPAKYFQFNTIQLRKTGAAPAVVPDYPTLGGTSVAVSRGNATLTVSGLDAGVTDGACDIYYAIAEEGQAFGAYTRGAQNVSGTSASFAISGIEEGHRYVYSVYAVNPATKLASLKTSGKFRIDANPGIPKEMTVEPLIRPGLIQAKFGEKVLFESQIQPPLVSNLLTQTDYDCSLDFTYGALMANQNCADASAKVLNTYKATQWNWDATYTVFAYEGEIYLREGQRLVIFGRFDDGEAAVVDGMTLLAQGNSSGYNNDPATRWVVYEPAESGWYPLNAWVWDWSSEKNCMIPPSALAYNLIGLTSINDQNRDQWKHLEDTDGKGSFLRFKEAKTLMTLGVPTTNGVDVTINAAFDDLPFPAKFVAYVSMSHDGGLDPLAWDDVVKIADIAAGDTAAADYVVKGLASYPFVRFAIESEGSISTAERCRNFRQMSRVVGFDSEGLSLIVTDPVFAKTNGTFNVIVADTGAVTPLSLNVEVSSDPAFGSTVYQGTIDGIVYPGRFPVAINGLTPGTTYYVRVKPTTAGDDAWVVSAPIETEVFGNLRINEIMASNGDTFKTKNGRSGLDWIEIYNGTDEVVDLSGWYLYDDPAKAQSKWKKIQGTCVIPVHGYGIVWCDKDYTDWDAANEAWSEIGLSTSGETVFLAKPDGTVVDTVTFGTQMKEIAYGVGKLPGSDEETHVFFKVSTPGAENGEYGYGPMTPTVSFSVPHGYKTAPIDVEITCADDPDADIYYTLDGSQPTTASTKYTASIHITSTTILRAGVPRANTVLQVDSSATYIYLDDVLAQGRMGDGAASETARLQTPSEKFPVTGTLPTGQDKKHAMRYGMIQSIVNGPDRERILRGFTNTVATLSIVMDPELLFGDEDGIYVNSTKYKADGAAGERPMLLEQIDPVNGAANEFSVPGGLRLRGSSSLAESNPKHSLRFFFRGQYGMAKLEFPLFGEEGADSFSKVDLRCSQNYSWSMNNSDYDTFIHELFSRDSQRDLGQPYTRTRYYNLFINGQYWGLYMTQERGDKDFAETYAGGNEDYYDCIKTSSNTPWGGYETGASDGTDAAWQNLQGLAYNGFVGDYVDNYNRALGLNSDGTRNPEYPILLNPENLMAYVTIAHFVCDADGPVSVGNGGLNNLYANRYQIDGGSSMDGFWFLRHDAEHSMGVKGEGEEFGKWTQVTNDVTGLGTHEYNPLNPDWSVHYRGEAPTKDNRSTENFGPYELHAQLAKNPVYRRAFADYFYKHYLKEGGAMTPAVAKQRFEARMAEIDDVVVSEAARWSQNENQPKSRETWLNACSNCLDFIEKRTPYMKESYQARGWYPTLEPPTADVADGEGAIGQVVTFTAADGAEIYVTTDGSDPAESGTFSTSATVPALPCTIKARAKLNDEWSPAQEVTLVAPKLTGDGLIITIAGNYTSTQELAPTGDVCRVILDDANVPGGLILKPGVAYTFEPAAETENVIGRIVGGDTSTFVLNGEGTLSMTGSDTLLTVNDLIVSNGTFAIKSTGVSAKKTPIVKVMGNLFQTGGVIDIDVSVDSSVQVYGIMLESKKMEAEFSGGELVAKVGGQYKSAAIVTDKGSSDIVFKKECKITAELSGVDSRLAFSAGEIKFAKTLVGPVVVTMPQDLTGVSEAHVFKAEKTIEINGGTFDINVPAPGSEIFAASRPGEKADEDPGIIVIKGGTFELVADDDCFNATDFIDVRAGLIYAVSLSDDVFDSNGGMDISGGTILAYATGAGHEAFDVEPEATQMTYPSTNEHVLAISGGTIFATGGANSAWPTTITTAEGVNLFSLANADVSAYTGKYLTLNSSPKVTAKLPVFPTSTGSVLATCPGFDGANVSVGDTAPTSGSQNFHDLYIHGSSGFIIIVQ